MPASSKRYAIRITSNPETYSNGPQARPVPFEKAKLWKNIGHVKTHLGQGGKHGPQYPATAQIVEIEVQYTLTPMEMDGAPLTPAVLIAGNKAKHEKRRLEREEAWAVQRLARAEQDLIAAHKAIEKFTRR